MSLIEIITIALSLAMDAFAVSVMLGLSAGKPRVKEYLLPGVYFGAFQGLMPLVGFFVGLRFVTFVEHIDNYIAFALLAFIGGKMIWESFSKDDEHGDSAGKNLFRAANMFVLAVATSIDALAVGVTFAFFEINIFLAVIIIGVVTCAMSMIGVKIGSVFGTKFKSQAELVGGLVLVLMGVKFLLGL